MADINAAGRPWRVAPMELKSVTPLGIGSRAWLERHTIVAPVRKHVPRDCVQASEMRDLGRIDRVGPLRNRPRVAFPLIRCRSAGFSRIGWTAPLDLSIISN